MTKWWANKHSMADEWSMMRTTSDIPIYLAAEVDAALAEKNARIAELEAALAEVTAHLEAHTAIRPLNPLQRWTITGEEPDEDDMPCGTMAAPDPEGQWVAIGDVHKLGVAFIAIQQQLAEVTAHLDAHRRAP